MSVTLYSHPDCLKHEMGQGHPERPARVEVILKALKAVSFQDQLIWKTATPVEKSQLLRVHDRQYIEHIFNIAPKSDYIALDPDTIMNPCTLNAALLAAGAVVDTVDDVFQGKTAKAFCVIRPPGHHAEKHRAMGFCFFNNIAVGVAHALEQYQCKRVAIVDFDVHHGNGTEDIFQNDNRVLLWSSFQYPFYPNPVLSDASENMHLVPLEAGASSAVFRKKVDEELVPLLEEFKPEVIFISAGFDAHLLDPLANLQLEAQDYGYITSALVKIADKYCQGRIISTLEGGYDLEALRESSVAHVGAMIG